MPSSSQESAGTLSNSWGILLSGIVDRLVEVLKKSRRWRRDGPSLRQVNRHWCLQLNQHIVAVRPHRCRVILGRDALSLLKFPHLTSIDATPFVGRDFWERTRARCSVVVKVLSKLPRLAQVQINRDVLCKLTEQDVKRIQKITSLHVADGVVRGESLVKLTGVPLKKLIVNGTVKNLGVFLAKTPSLKSLDAWISEPKSSADVLGLKALDEVTLRVHGSVNPFISDVTSLVSLDISCCGLSRVDPLASLPKLRHLVLNVDRRAVLDSVLFQKLLRKLTSLDLRSQEWCMILPDNFLDDALSLRSLVLFQFTFMGRRLLGQRLRTLCSLTLSRCCLKDGYAFLRTRSPLKTLSLNDNTSTQEEFHPVENQRMIVTGLSDLKHLEIQFDRDFRLDNSLLDQIRQLVQLKSLRFPGALTEFPYEAPGFPYERFQALASLPNLSEFMISGPAHRILLESIIRMDFLIRLERLTIRPLIEQHDHIWFENQVRSLREKAPHLKLETDFLRLASFR